MFGFIRQLILLVTFAFISGNKLASSNFQMEKFQNLLGQLTSILPNWKPKFVENHEALINFKMQFRDYMRARSGQVNTPPMSGASFLELKKGYISSDAPSLFLGTNYVSDITQLPLSGSAKNPWSGSYWQMRAGLTSVRYDRSNRNSIGVWDPVSGVFTSYYIWGQSVGMYSQPADHNSNLGNIASFIDAYYSPSEKYDYLVGDYNYSLTNHQKRTGQIFQKNNDIPSWFGICHGWAAASYYYQKPLNTVTLYAADGRTRIRFFPDDIKALASLFWANANYVTKFVGDICPFYNTTSTNSDAATGLFTDERCFAINPATFMLILGNQMGINGRNFILDTAEDPEKWNQPVQNYINGYFNLITNTFYPTAADSMVPLSSLQSYKNPFFKFLLSRAARGTVNVVGVLMQVTYALESEAIRGPTPLPEFDETKQYVAALELDANNKIIGGEWMFNKHPNYAWKFDETVSPYSLNDNNVKFNGSVADLRRIARYAPQTSSRGQILRSIVDYMVNRSQNP